MQNKSTICYHYIPIRIAKIQEANNAKCWQKYGKMGTSLAVQWLRLHTSTAGGMDLTPGWGTKIPH